MKKIYILLLCALLPCAFAQGQILSYGARVGLGPSWVSDDLLTSSPIVGANLGGFVNYGFTSMHSAFADNLFVQTGLYLTRRGSNFHQKLVNMQSYREGFYHSWYAQVPILAGWRWEMPLPVASQYLNFYFGPAINVGLFGRLWDRQVTPGYPQESVNYDSFITGSKDDRSVFKNIRRVDVSLVVGVGYQHGRFTYDLWWDHGFVPLRTEDDVLNNMERAHQEETGASVDRKSNGYKGVNNIIMVSIGYLVPNVR